MIMNMLDTAGTSMQRTDAARTFANNGAQLASDGSTTQAGGFHQLLAQLSGQDLSLDGKTQSNISGLLLLHSQLHMMTLEDGTEASQQLAWLEQLAVLLEEAGEQLAAELQQQPELAQLLASFVTAASQGHEGQPLQQTANVQASADQLIISLKDLIQQFTAKLSTSSSSPETAAAVRGLQQLLEPLLAANQASIQVRSEADAAIRTVSADRDSARTDLHATLQRAANSAQAMNGNEQRLGTNGANETQPGLPSVHTAQGSSMAMPRADLLRPELLALALGDGGDAATVEVKLSDTVVMSTAPSAETAKTAGELSFSRMANTQPEQVPAERFVEAMNRVVARSFQITQMNGMAEARISLVPEHLGQVDIKLTMQNGQLTAQIVTETVLGREALEQQLGALRSALQGQGIQVEKLEVVQQSNTATSSFREQGQQQHSSRQYEQSSQQSNRSGYEDAKDFVDELEMIGTDYDTNFVHGRTFTATA